MVARSVPAKRKQAADMPQSPPKRVTRARAAKAPEEEIVKPKATRAKPSTTTKSTSTAKKTASTTASRTARSKTAAKDEPITTDNQIRDEEVQAVTEVTAKGSTRSRQHKASEDNDNVNEESEIKKPRGRQRKAAVSVEERPEAPKSRGKSTRSGASTKKVKSVQEAEVSEREPVETAQKTVRARVPAKTTAKTTRATAASKTTVSKKKVQFADEQDKENIPIQAEAAKKAGTKATGMKAKPIRKPAAPKTTTRGRRAAKIVPDEESSKPDAMPLSPKKVNQVAKTPSSSEDELATQEKTPMKSLNKSPIKMQFSPMKLALSPSKPAPSSPTKELSASILASPAKRPPKSPFKDSMKSPAKKFELGTSILKPSLTASQSETPFKTSLLQVSPKKVRIMEEDPKDTFSGSVSPFKRSLLQSPARRPLSSPLKAISLTPRQSPLKVTKKSVKAAATPLSTSFDVAANALASITASNQQDSFSEAESDLGTRLQEEPLSPSPEVDTGYSTWPLNSDGDVQSVVPEEQPLEQAEESKDLVRFDIPTRGEASVSAMECRRISTNSQLSEDELASPDKRFAPTPLRKQGAEQGDDTTVGLWDTTSMTPLADKFNSWAASSPDKQRPSRQQRGIFSLPAATHDNETCGAPLDDVTDAGPEAASKSSFFEDDMAMLDAEPSAGSGADADSPGMETLANLGISMESYDSQEYGDENVMPSEAELLRADQDANNPTLTITPAKVFTPAKQISYQTREVYTVSKVPLRPSAEDSPLKLPRQRSKSLGGALAVLADDSSQPEDVPEQPLTPQLAPIALPQTPSSGVKLDLETPGRTSRKSGSSDVLKGAVVFVDVHTSEGADASGIFVDLLTQMGARCVKQWNWNPRASLGDSLDGSESPDSKSTSTPTANKIGITHVVYKDGGVRTMEKVRLSSGVVTCVGVGWVLDCEQADKWLNEADYAIDTGLVPRGGQRRRKSMEPRALANLGGNLVPAIGGTPAKTSDVSPTKEFLTFNTPASRRDTFILDPQQVTRSEADQLSEAMAAAPATPLMAHGDEGFDIGLTANSPTTPYYLSKGAELVQSTCPPKQKGGGIFPITGNVEDESDDQVRQKLLAARRKTLQWQSKTQSPLGRTVSYGK